MAFKTNKVGVLGGISAILLAASATAAIDTTDPFVGTSVTYTDVVESTGDPFEDPLPLYGDPVLLSGNLLDFDPVGFPFAASSPPADTTDGSLNFNVCLLYTSATRFRGSRSGASYTPPPPAPQPTAIGPGKQHGNSWSLGFGKVRSYWSRR